MSKLWARACLQPQTLGGMQALSAEGLAILIHFAACTPNAMKMMSMWVAFPGQ